MDAAGRRARRAALLFDRFKQAVREADRPNVVVAGLVTEGCVLQTVLGGGIREGYRMHVSIDASAAATRAIHEAAIQRMIQAGAVPVSTFSLAAEFVVDPSVAPGADTFMKLTQKYQPEMMNMAAYFDWLKRTPASRRSLRRASRTHQPAPQAKRKGRRYRWSAPRTRTL